MNDLTSDAILLALGGFLGFVIREVLSAFYLGPAHRLRQLIGKIAFSLDFYANRLAGDTPEGRETRETFRRQACELRELSYAVPSYWLFAHIFRLVPKRKNVLEASGELIGLSNCNFTFDADDRPSDRSRTIKRLLGIKPA